VWGIWSIHIITFLRGSIMTGLFLDIHSGSSHRWTWVRSQWRRRRGRRRIFTIHSVKWMLECSVLSWKKVIFIGLSKQPMKSGATNWVNGLTYLRNTLFFWIYCYLFSSHKCQFWKSSGIICSGIKWTLSNGQPSSSDIFLLVSHVPGCVDTMFYIWYISPLATPAST